MSAHSLTHDLALQMAQLVSEKDSGLRQAMRTMGLMESSYWGSWAVFDLIFATLLALVINFSGKQFSGKHGKLAAAVRGAEAARCM